jgi:hypothetical protein
MGRRGRNESRKARGERRKIRRPRFGSGRNPQSDHGPAERKRSREEALAFPELLAHHGYFKEVCVKDVTSNINYDLYTYL